MDFSSTREETDVQISLKSIAFPTLVRNPYLALEGFSEYPELYIESLFDQLPKIDRKVLRIILYSLYELGFSLQKLWNLRKIPTLPEWYYNLDQVPVENLLVAIKYDLPLNPDGNLILWSQIGKKLNHDILDTLISRGVDINQINQEDGLTLLQKAVQVSSEDNVRMLLSHGANPEQVSQSGQTAMEIALEADNTFSNGSSLHIIRDLRVYGARIDQRWKLSSDVQRYLTAATLLKPEYCSGNKDYLQLDRDEDLTIQAICHPELLSDPAFQSALGRVNLEAFSESIQRKNDEVTVNAEGEVMAWPFYFPPKIEAPLCERIPKRVTLAIPPSDDRVYELALAGLPDIEKPLGEERQSVPVSRNIIPTDFSPPEFSTVSLPLV